MLKTNNIFNTEVLPYKLGENAEEIIKLFLADKLSYDPDMCYFEFNKKSDKLEIKYCDNLKVSIEERDRAFFKKRLKNQFVLVIIIFTLFVFNLLVLSFRNYQKIKIIQKRNYVKNRLITDRKLLDFYKSNLANNVKIAEYLKFLINFPWELRYIKKEGETLQAEVVIKSEEQEEVLAYVSKIEDSLIQFVTDGQTIFMELRI